MTPEEFPYITEIKVNDCYAYKDFVIPIGKGDDGKPFRHLILTGKNGSGKTTILKSLANQLTFLSFGYNQHDLESKEKTIEFVRLARRKEISKFLEYKDILGLVDFLSLIKVELANNVKNLVKKITYLLADFTSQRRLELQDVESVLKDDDIHSYVSKSDISDKINQYLVNKKVFQAFDLIDNKKKDAETTDIFFSNFEKQLKKIFEDNQLELIFVREEFRFYIQLKDSRRITFNQLADGYSAIIRIILDLLIRVDILKRSNGSYNFEPCGIVIIDEPEAHLHLELQYQVLPLLTTLFPNIQFIVATHSPAVISSIPNAVVYDLTKQEAVSDWVVGSSYSELMVKHFGLDNEYSNIADKIIADIQQLVDDKNMMGKEKLAALKKLLDENGRYLAPSTMLEVETNILRIQEAS